MSNIGLNSNIFHSMRTYLELLNHFIVDTNYEKISGNKSDNHRVIEFFNSLSGKKIIDPNLRLIKLAIQSHYRTQGKDPEKTLIEIANKIEMQKGDKNLITEIEGLLHILKDQYNESHARLKGE